MTDSETDSQPNQCDKCGYEWMYGGELWTTTCPRCNKKTKTPLHPERESVTAD